MNEITVLFFATMRDYVGKRKIRLDLPENSRVEDLKAILAERYPAAGEALNTTLVSVNREYASDHDLIPNQAEVALFPQVSGG
jgi:molybdopterin synthase catalytic subunit